MLNPDPFSVDAVALKAARAENLASLIAEPTTDTMVFADALAPMLGPVAGPKLCMLLRRAYDEGANDLGGLANMSLEVIEGLCQARCATTHPHDPKGPAIDCHFRKTIERHGKFLFVSNRRANAIPESAVLAHTEMTRAASGRRYTGPPLGAYLHSKNLLLSFMVRAGWSFY